MTTSLRSAAWRTALLLAVFTAGGCYAYRPVALAPAPRSRVRIVFVSAIVLSTLPFAGDSVALLLYEVRAATAFILVIISTITKGF